jgi:hypothetical protein
LPEESKSIIFRTHFESPREAFVKTYKLDGVRFLSKEDLIDNMWQAYQDKMSREEFDKYIAENMVEEEK